MLCHRHTWFLEFLQTASAHYRGLKFKNIWSKQTLKCENTSKNGVNFFQRITKLIHWQDLFIYTHYFLEYTMGQNFKYSGIKQNYSGMSNLAFITVNDLGWLSPAKNWNYKRFYFFYLDSQVSCMGVLLLLNFLDLLPHCASVKLRLVSSSGFLWWRKAEQIFYLKAWVLDPPTKLNCLWACFLWSIKSTWFGS